MKSAILINRLSSLVFALGTIHAQELAPGEKIRDISPDKKSAMRISYDNEMNQKMIQAAKAKPDMIFSETIKAIELVSLPRKAVLANLLPDDELGGGNNYHDITLMWSPDSKWCAFFWSFPRFGYTTVYKQHGDKFVEINRPNELVVQIEGRVRNQYIRPIRWSKPGILILEQSSVFYGDEGSTIHFTASFGDKGKFRIVDKKDVSGDVRKLN
jgi:hypothetical protein